MLKYFSIPIIIIITFACADLRTGKVKKDPQEDKGMELLAAMAEAHHVKAWDSVQTYSVFFQDHFYGRIGKLANPFPEEVMRMCLDYVPGIFHGRICFESGAWNKNQWVIFSDQTYENVNQSDTLRSSKNKDIRFWVPTYQYFVEFPARIGEATAIGYLGEKQIGNENCEGVMVSWETLKPQRDIDQYIIWLDHASHQIVKIEYTIREVNTPMKGAVYFKDYKLYNGLLLPSRMPVESNLVRDGMLHEMRIDSIHFNEISVETLEPSPSLIKIDD